MSAIKRVNGDYNIVTLNVGDSINFETTSVNVIGDLTVTGNASLTGNIAGDKIFNGTTSIEIQTPNGNANVSIGGISNIAVFAGDGVYVTGRISASGNVLTSGNALVSGYAVITGNVTGGNVEALGNIQLTGNSSATQPTLRFNDTNTVVAAGQYLGAVEWYTNDLSGGARVTSAIRSNVSSVAGNATVEFLTSTNGAAATVKMVILENGNVGVANTAPAHKFTVSGTAYVSSTLTAIGNITGGNLLTAGSSTATGNIQGGNLRTSGQVSATGNVTGGNIISVASISAVSVSTTGNVTGGNLRSQGVISSIGNVTATDYFGTSLSVTGNVTSGNVSTGNISGSNVSVSAGLSGVGRWVTNYAVLSSDAVLSSPTPVDIGTLTFAAVANQRYKFDAYVVMEPDGSMTVAPAVSFSSGTCLYTTEYQTNSTTAWSVATKNTSDDVTTTYSSVGTGLRTLRISGVFFHTANVTVAMRFQNSVGNITAKTGSYLAYTYVA